MSIGLRSRNSGLVQKRLIGGNSGRGVMARTWSWDFVWRWLALRGGRSVSVESLESEQLQPMRVGVTPEQFGRTFADSLRSITACISVLVEEETQQIQIVIADVPPQEEVVPQAAIEILDQRAGARYVGHRLDYSGFDPMVPLAKGVLELCSTLPIGGLSFVPAL